MTDRRNTNETQVTDDHGIERPHGNRTEKRREEGADKSE